MRWPFPSLPLLLPFPLLIAFVSLSRWALPHVALEDIRLDGDQEDSMLEEAAWTIGNFSPVAVPSASPVAITVVAAKRQKPYVLEVVASLLRSFPSSLPPLLLCNVEVATNTDVESLGPSWEVVDMNVGASIDVSSLSARIAKETDDYWSCLNLTRHSDRRYTLLLEDDASVHERMEEMVADLASQMDHRPYIDYVKLYHVNRLRHISSLPQALAFSLLSAFLVYHIVGQSSFSSRLLCVLGSASLFYWTLQYGCTLPADVRYWASSSVYLTMGESCCTPAVLFRTSSIGRMVDRLEREESRAGRAKDHILDESPFTGRETDFNLVSHIGKVSSLQRFSP